MRIAAIFCWSLEPGHANLDLISLFGELKKKHNIYLFSSSESDNRDNITYYKIGSASSSRILYPVKWLVRKSISKQATIPSLSEPTITEKASWRETINNLDFMLSVLMLYRRINRTKPDIIISDSLFFVAIPVFIISRILRKPLVIYCRELIPENRSHARAFLQTLRRFVLKKSELIVAVDKGLEEYFQKEVRKPVHLIPISVDLEHFESKIRNVRTELNLPADDRMILYLGNLSMIHMKGLQILLEAFHRVKESIGSVKVVIGGKATASAESMAYLNNLIERLSLKDSVIFLPWLPYSIIPALIYSCDICIDCYTKPDDEEFQVGTKMLEYMAAGKPVLAVNVTGNRFIIEDGYNGMLAEPDVEDFYEKLMLLLTDMALANSLGENALRTVKTHYDSRVVAGRFEELISHLIHHE